VTICKPTWKFWGPFHVIKKKIFQAMRGDQPFLVGGQAKKWGMEKLFGPFLFLNQTVEMV
jgi:hypothetical protein